MQFGTLYRNIDAERITSANSWWKPAASFSTTSFASLTQKFGNQYYFKRSICWSYGCVMSLALSCHTDCRIYDFSEMATVSSVLPVPRSNLESTFWKCEWSNAGGRANLVFKLSIQVENFLTVGIVLMERQGIHFMHLQFFEKNGQIETPFALLHQNSPLT